MGNLTSLLSVVNGALRVGTAIIRGFFVGVYDTIFFVLSLSWWMILIVVALPILLLSLLAVPGVAIGIVVQVINLFTALSNLFWVDTWIAFRPLITYSIPFLMEGMEVLREFGRALVFDELCPEGLDFECTAIQRVIGFFEIIRLINVGYTTILIAFIEGIGKSMQTWLCNVEVLIDSANAIQCVVPPEGGNFSALLDGLNNPTYFYLIDESLLRRVRQAAYFVGYAIEFVSSVAEAYLAPTLLMLIALMLHAVQILGIYIFAFLSFFSSIIFMLVRTFQVANDPSVATGVWEDAGTHVTPADYRNNGLIAIVTDFLDSYDPADLLRPDPSIGYFPPGDPEYVEIMLEIVLTVGDIIDIAVDFFPTAMIILDTFVCAVSPPNTLDCAARFKLCEFFFDATPVGSFEFGSFDDFGVFTPGTGVNDQPGVMSAGLFELYTLLGAGINDIIESLDNDVFDPLSVLINTIPDALEEAMCAAITITNAAVSPFPFPTCPQFFSLIGFPLPGGFPSVDIGAELAVLASRVNDLLLFSLTSVMDALLPVCQNLLTVFGAEEGGCICDACVYTQEQSDILKEVSPFLPLGLENGAPCIPWEGCCLQRGTIYYDRFCFPQAQDKYTSMWIALTGSLGTLFAIPGPPDRCKELSAMLEPIDGWSRALKEVVFSTPPTGFATEADNPQDGQFGVYSPLLRDHTIKKSSCYALEPVSVLTTASSYPRIYTFDTGPERYDTWLLHMEWFRPTRFDGDTNVSTSVDDVLAFSAGKVSPAPTPETVEAVLQGRCGNGNPLINLGELFPMGAWNDAEGVCRYVPTRNTYCLARVEATNTKDPILQLFNTELDDDTRARWKKKVFPGMACFGFQWAAGSQCYSDAYTRFVVPPEVEADFPEQKTDILSLNPLTAAHAYCPVAYNMLRAIDHNLDDHAMCTMVTSVMMEHWESGLRWRTYMGDGHMHTVANRSPEHFRRWEATPPWTLIDHVIQVSENTAVLGEWCNVTLRLQDLPFFNETYPDCVAAILALASIYNGTTTNVDISNFHNGGPATPSFPGGQPWAFEPHEFPGSAANLLLGEVEVQTDHISATPRVVGNIYHPFRQMKWEAGLFSTYWDWFNTNQPPLFEDTDGAAAFHKLFDPTRLIRMLKNPVEGIGIPLFHPFETVPPFVFAGVSTLEDFRSLESFLLDTLGPEGLENVAAVLTPLTNYPINPEDLAEGATEFLRRAEVGRWQSSSTLCGNHSFDNEFTQHFLAVENIGFGLLQARLILLEWREFFGVINPDGSSTLRHTCVFDNLTMDLVCGEEDRCKQDPSFLLGITPANLPDNYTRVGLDCESLLSSGDPFDLSSTIFRAYFKAWTSPLDITTFYLPRLILDDFPHEALTPASGTGPGFHYFPAKALLEGETRPGTDDATFLAAFMSMLHTYANVTLTQDGGEGRYGTDERLAILDAYWAAQDADPGMPKFEQGALEQCEKFHHLRPDLCAGYLEDRVVLRCVLDPYCARTVDCQKQCVKLYFERHHTGPQGRVMLAALDDFSFIRTSKLPENFGY